MCTNLISGIEILKYLAYNEIGSTLDTLLCDEILRNVLLLNFFLQVKILTSTIRN